jgi:hypothetical protein
MASQAWLQWNYNKHPQVLHTTALRGDGYNSIPCRGFTDVHSIIFGLIHIELIGILVKKYLYTLVTPNVGEKRIRHKTYFDTIYIFHTFMD